MPGIRSFFIAKFYDATMHNTEKRCLSEWRHEIIASATGAVLEIGSGTGVNLSYYPNDITRLVLSDPDANMRKELSKKISLYPDLSPNIEPSACEVLPFPDNTFDTVVGTLVICSVNHVDQSLREISRVLQPGGRYIFLEHVACEQNPRVYRWQKRIQPVWRYFCGNCHPARKTFAHIQNAGFRIDWMKQDRMRGLPSIVQPTIRGIAIKPVSPET